MQLIEYMIRLQLVNVNDVLMTEFLWIKEVSKEESCGVFMVTFWLIYDRFP